MDSVRGQNKEPGQFRKDQNWIGSRGCTIEEATFVPSSPLQLLDHLEDWEKYLHYEDFDTLVQAAIVHAQFELVHPFKDGNGRIGRLLIPLFLFSKEVLVAPMFYLSAYLELHRDKYYGALQSISQEGNWNGWIEFFLEAVTSQALDNSKKVRSIMALYEAMKEKIRDITHSQYSIQILDAIFERPIFQTSDFVRSTKIPKQTAMPLLRQLRDENILTVLRKSSGRRPGIFAFPELFNIAEGQKIF
jgi:Fic family protein